MQCSALTHDTAVRVRACLLLVVAQLKLTVNSLSLLFNNTIALTQFMAAFSGCSPTLYNTFDLTTASCNSFYSEWHCALLYCHYGYGYGYGYGLFICVSLLCYVCAGSGLRQSVCGLSTVRQHAAVLVVH